MTTMENSKQSKCLIKSLNQGSLSEEIIVEQDESFSFFYFFFFSFLQFSLFLSPILLYYRQYRSKSQDAQIKCIVTCHVATTSFQRRDGRDTTGDISDSGSKLKCRTLNGNGTMASAPFNSRTTAMPLPPMRAQTTAPPAMAPTTAVVVHRPPLLHRKC